MTESTITDTPPASRLRWSLPITARIAIAIVILACCGVVLSSALNFIKFEKSLSNLADSHYTFLLNDTHGTIEASTAIGVPLSNLGNVQGLLERAKKTEPAIVAVEVTDPEGHILYASTPERVGQKAPTDWPMAATPKEVWRIDGKNSVTLGEPVVNAFEATVGTLTLTYSTTYYQRKGDAVLADLTRVALPMTLGAAVITLIGCLIVLRPFRRSLRAMARRLETTLADKPDTEDGKTLFGLEGLFSGFLARLSHSHTGQAAPSVVEPPDDGSRRLLYPTFILTAVVLLVPLLVLSYVSVSSFKNALVPEMHAEGAALARAVSKDISRALDLRIPIDEMVDVSGYLDGMLKLMPQAKYIAIADSRGELLYSGGLTTDQVLRELRRGHPQPTPLNSDYGLIETADVVDIALALPSDDPNSFGRGFVHVGIATSFLEEQTRDIMFNVGVMSLSGLLITFEILLLVMAIVILHPLLLIRRLLAMSAQGDLGVNVRAIGRDELGRLIMLIQRGLTQLREMLGGEKAQGATREVHAPHMAFMRTPLFLFCFAEEFARSFFPLYTNNLAEGIKGLSPSLLASLPITIFMLLVAAGTPLSAMWSDRHGRRPAFLIGATLSTLGLGLSAIAGSYWEILGYRALSGIGYAMVFIASQGYVLDNTTDRDRTRGMAVYIAAITGADIAGPPIGGILSDELGFRGALLVAAGFIAASGIIAWLFMHDAKKEREERRPFRIADLLLLLQNVRFTSLMVCVSMPAKLLLAGFLFYLVPLHLSALNENEAMIGRVIMVYALSSIAITPIAARITDRWGALQSVVIGGALISGTGLAALFVQDSLISIIIAVAGLGLGQACTISAQLSLVTKYAHDEVEWLGRTTVVSIFRLVERLGGVIGPLGAGALLVMVGAREAIISLGCITVGGALLMIIILCVLSRREGEAS